jgi:hypothetical protein
MSRSSISVESEDMFTLRTRAQTRMTTSYQAQLSPPPFETARSSSTRGTPTNASGPIRVLAEWSNRSPSVSVGCVSRASKLYMNYTDLLHISHADSVLICQLCADI